MSVQGAMFNPYMNYNNYSNYAAMSNFSGMDDFSYMGMNYPMMYGGFGSGNYKQYYDNMFQMQDFYAQYNLKNVERQRQQDIVINSADAGIQRTLNTLQEKIVQNEQTQIQEALENFKNAIKAKYPNATPQQIRDYTSQIYQEKTQRSLTADIREYGSNSFLQGFKQAIGFGLFADNKTAEENCAEIEGITESRSSQMAKHAGRTAGGATIGAAAGALICSIFKGLKGNKTLPGVIIGAIAAGIGTFIISKAKG